MAHHFGREIRILAGFAAVLICSTASVKAEESASRQFARENLVAWCIVPFDARKRGPEERAEMLSRLGFTRFAYDYRAEHIPTFDEEMETLARYGIRLEAFWFPAGMNDEAKLILALLERHEIKTQLWVTLGGGEANLAPEAQRDKVREVAAQLLPVAREAERIGCSVGLYNHGGWFGEPENQIEVIREMNMSNVGIVYNLHHGHAHLERFESLLGTMMPHLLCLNLNGMDTDGESRGRKIL